MQRNFEPMRKRTVRDLYLEPKYEEFRSRTIGSLSNAFTQPSRNSTRFPNSEQRRSWESSWRLDSLSRFDRTTVPALAAAPHYCYFF